MSVLSFSDFSKIPISTLNIFFVPSMINPPADDLDRNIKRSVFSMEDRIYQTINGLMTLREKIKNISIILIESSDIVNNKNIMNLLYQYSDYIINAYNDDDCRNACYSKNKSLGEITTTLKFFQNLNVLGHKYEENRNENQNKIRIFKLSGRYYLTDEFNISKFVYDKISFRCFEERSLDGIRRWASTMLYCIPASFLPFMIEYYIVKRKELNDEIICDIETALYDSIFTFPVNILDEVCAAGLISINGELATH